MGIKAGTEGGGAFRRRGKTPSSAQPAKPFRPIENTFPEKKGFRLGQYEVIEEKDDYLICVGYDPNAKDPFAEITPASPRTIKIAKPPALQRTPWDGQSVDLGGVTYTYEYSNDEYGVRTARWTDDTGEEREEEQRIDVPYTIDDDQVEHQIIVAVEIRKSAAVDGTDFREVERDDEGEVTEEGSRLLWMDLNVSGRHWAAPASSSEADDGFPPGTDDCDCGHCIAGVDMPASSTVCCWSHLRWTFVDPVFGGTKELLYTTGNVWVSDPFTGPDCGGNSNQYRWKLTFSTTVGNSVLEVVTETDDGCDETCVKYVSTVPLQCLCNNELRLAADWDLGSDISRDDIYCKVCLKPQQDDPCPICSTDDVGWNVYITEDATPSEPYVVTGGAVPAYQGIEELACAWGACKGETCDDPILGGTYVSMQYWTQPDPSPDIVLLTYYNFATTFFEHCQVSLGSAFECDGSWELTCEGTDDGLPEYHVRIEPRTVSNSGSCAGCTTGAPPVDADPGACCVYGDCYEYMSETDCGDFGGIWHESMSECEEECEGLGACCTCTLSGQYLCYGAVTHLFCALEALGIFYPGVDCDGVEGCTTGEPCDHDEPLGSCCDEATGDCVDAVAEGDCADTWTERGICADCVVADPTVGCCTDEGLIGNCICTEMLQSECEAIFGSAFCVGGCGGCTCEAEPGVPGDCNAS